MDKKYNYFYKITNLANGHFYYGVHSTNDLDDGYMGSGKRLHSAYKKYGVESFSKEILHFFDNRNDALNFESEYVTESLVEDDRCYNLVKGGGYLDTAGKVPVLDEETNKYVFIDSNEYNKHKEKYKTPLGGCMLVKRNNSNDYEIISTNEYYRHKNDYTTASSGMVSVKDRVGNYYYVSVNDERYISGELKPIWFGKKHTQETRNKMCKTLREHKHQQGCKNSQYGKCWVTKDGENKSIKKEDFVHYSELGWKLGRHLLNENDKISYLDKNKILKMRCEGLTWPEIAKRSGVSTCTIFKYKKKFLT